MKVEQRDQLMLMIDALTRDFYHPVGEIALSGFKAEKKYLLKEFTRGQSRQSLNTYSKSLGEA